MVQRELHISGIPAILWGAPSARIYIHVHGKMSSKEQAEDFAELAAARGFQTLSFDLPQHGERAGETDRCDIWNGTRDLCRVADWVFARWADVSLFACSLGAYFSLHALADRPLRRCLFQSPILDMEYLVRQMMLWFDISEERLQAEEEIDNPVDPLRWDYYQYIKAHPVQAWPIPTAILYGGRDDLQSREVVESFSQKHGCTLTVSEASGHAFMKPGDHEIVRQWISTSLLPKITVLSMTRKYLADCTALYIRAFSGEPWYDKFPSEAPVSAYFENFLQLDSFLGYVALLDGKLAALSVGMKKPWIGGVEYYIDEFCVDPNLQGQGIGSQFLAAIEADLSARGLHGILLNTEKDFPAYRFYTKNGFQKLGGLCVLGK